MKQKYLLISAFVVLVAFASLYALNATSGASGKAFVSSSSLTGDRATTSVVYLVPGALTATSSLIVDTQNTDHIALNLMTTVASTTDAVVQFQVGFSNNYDARTGAGDWYYKACQNDETNATSTLIASASTCMNFYSPGATATTTASIEFANIAARFTRFDFNAQTASTTLHAEVAKREPLN